MIGRWNRDPSAGLPCTSKGHIATQHSLLNNTCDIDGETAHSETYYLFAARNRATSRNGSRERIALQPSDARTNSLRVSNWCCGRA